MEAIDRAADVLGSQTNLATLLGVSKGAVNQWKGNGRRVPAEHCPLIERATRQLGHPVLCEDLRPDVAWNVLRDSHISQPIYEVDEARHASA